MNRLLRDFRTDEVHPIDPTLLDLLFDLQTKAGSDRPFQVISGYRSPKTNEMLRHSSDGVAQHSMHLLGRAIDIRLESFPTRRLGELARSMAAAASGSIALRISCTWIPAASGSGKAIAVPPAAGRCRTRQRRNPPARPQSPGPSRIES